MNDISIRGYKDNSPYKNRPYNIINSNIITMKGVSKPLTLIPIIKGIPHYDKKVIAQPGDDDIKFNDDVEGVLEIPYAQAGEGVIGNGTLTNPQYPVNNSSYIIPRTNLELPQIPNLNLYGLPNTIDNTVDLNIPTTQEWLNRDKNLGYTVDANGVNITGDPNNIQQLKADNTKMQIEAGKKKGSPFIGAINPYGGWNMNNTSTALGAFIQDKNLLGTIGSAGKLLMMGARNAFAGAGAMKRYREAQEEYEQDMYDAERNSKWRWMQKGGNIGKMATGHYIQGNDEHPSPNVEIEAKEYLQTPDGSTMQVLGKRHSEGGEMLNLPEGTKVISDYLKIGSKLASFFKKEYGLNVTAGSKFATVMSQYKNKIGLTELLDEEEKLINKTIKQEEVELEGTREINLQVLSQKIQELQPKKQELERKFQIFTNIVFDKQEATKEKGGINYKKQEGGDVTGMEQPLMENENMNDDISELEQIIIAYSQVTNEDPSQIIQQLQQLQSEDELEQAVEQMIMVIQQAQGGGQNPQEESLEGEYSNPQEEQQEMKFGGSLSGLNFLQKGGKQSTNNKMTIYEFADFLETLGIPTTTTNEGWVNDRYEEYTKGKYKNVETLYKELKPAIENTAGIKLPDTYSGFKLINRNSESNLFENFFESKQSPVSTSPKPVVTTSNITPKYYTEIYNTPDDFLNFMNNDYKENPDGDYKDIASQAIRARAKWRPWTTVTDEDLINQETQDMLAGRGQKSVLNLSPKLGTHYSRYAYGTQDGLQRGIDDGLLNADELKKLGVKFTKDGKVAIGSWGSIPKENVFKIQEYIRSRIDAEPEKAKGYIESNFNDNKWYYRAPDIRGIKFKSQEDIENFVKDYELVDDINGNKIYYSKKNGLYFTPVTGDEPLDFTKKRIPPTSIEAEEKQTINTNVENSPLGNKDTNTFEMPLTVPVPTDMNPVLLQPGLRQVGHVQANRIKTSPEETIKELNRQYNTASDLMIENNPFTAGAFMANSQAQLNNSINQAYTQADMANNADERNVDNINEGRIQQRETTNLGLLDQYEDKAQSALQNYYSSWKRLFEKKDIQQANNWDMQNQQNMFNAINPNIKISGLGQIRQTEESPQFFIINGEKWLRDPKTGYMVKETRTTDSKGNSTTTSTSTTKTNQKGGLILKGNIKKYFK